MSKNNKSPISIDWNALGKMLGGAKLGSGVMGKSIQLCALLVILGGATAFAFADSDWGVLIVALILLLIFYVARRAFNFVDENPASALLEGSKLIRALEIEQIASDDEIVIAEQEHVENTSPPLALIDEAKDDDADA